MYSICNLLQQLTYQQGMAINCTLKLAVHDRANLCMYIAFYVYDMKQTILAIILHSTHCVYYKIEAYICPYAYATPIAVLQ
jgi:hypothetical protein